MQLYSEALLRLQSGIELLDQANAPGHIAAHVDLAMHQLRQVMDSELPGECADRSQSEDSPD
jgi:hypothetical protein